MNPLALKSLTLPSPAKVNLRLEVLSKRPDGYHDLRMVMTRISLDDEVVLSLQAKGITLSCDNPAVPAGEENIAWKAAFALIEAKRLDTGVHIDIKKRIPMGGGLGGGSSNAATVLTGLNELTGGKASQQELMNIGVKLGADVPFFVFRGPAFAEGIGEKLTLITDLPELWFALINPGVHIPTGEIFANLNLGLTKNHEKLSITGFNQSLPKVISILKNDLEKVAFARHPEVKKAKQALLNSGAKGALMSGSGATVFGIYDSLNAAESAIKDIKGKPFSKTWNVFSARTL